MFLSLFLLLLFASLSAYLASQRGRDPVAWFMIGILLGIFSPLILLLLKPLPQKSKVEEEEKEKEVQIQAPEPHYEKKEWFYVDENRHQQGPIHFRILRSLWFERKINEATYVWAEGMPEWKHIRELPDFLA